MIIGKTVIATAETYGATVSPRTAWTQLLPKVAEWVKLPNLITG